jgi:hypothetical protein
LIPVYQNKTRIFMKSNWKNLVLAGSCVIAASGMIACTGNSSGNIVTEIDSARLYQDHQNLHQPHDRAADGSTGEHGTGHYSDPINLRNAVKVDVNPENINWDAFRDQFNTQDIGAQTSIADAENIATGPWTDFEDFSYRLVYRMENEALWLQTFLRIDDDNAHLDPSANIQVLSMEKADSLKLGTLWTQMELLGTRLEDSLNVTRPNPRQ